MSTPFVVGVTGGSGSGKTALCRVVAGALGPADVSLVSHDSYYRDRHELAAAERAALNDNVPDAFDTPLFLEHLGALCAGCPVRPPRYCFVTHCRLGLEAVVEPRRVLLVEGTLLLHEPEIRRLLDVTFFLDVRDDVRLARCMRRGTTERGRARLSVLAQFEATVGGAHARYVEPTKAFADVVLSNVARVDRVAEVATEVIRARLSRRVAETA